MSNYIASTHLENAVVVAYTMSKPLLLTGEPGCGKTQCASWIKDTRYTEAFQHLFRFNVKTTSSARDLFYRYDAIQHFRAAQRPKEGEAVNILDYIHFTALGLAILAASAGQRCVVLIDEIDKAPRDFPNDLLNEIENFEFRIEEAPLEEIIAYKGWSKKLELIKLGINEPHFDKTTGVFSCPDKAPRPFILLTSNSEKNLPDAFMRRCAYFHVEFPMDKKTLYDIIDKRKNSQANKPPQDMKERLVKIFMEVRGLDFRKKPGIAEMLDWLNYLVSLDNYTKEGIKQAASLLAKNKEDDTQLKIFIDKLLQ